MVEHLEEGLVRNGVECPIISKVKVVANCEHGRQHGLCDRMLCGCKEPHAGTEKVVGRGEGSWWNLMTIAMDHQLCSIEQ